MDRRFPHRPNGDGAVLASRQIVQPFPWNEAPRFLVRDGDRIHGEMFQRTLDRMLIEEIRTAPRSPWQSAYVEHVIGTLRREVEPQDRGPVIERPMVGGLHHRYTRRAA